MKYLLALALTVGALTMPMGAAQAVPNECEEILPEAVQLTDLYTAKGKPRVDLSRGEKLAITEADSIATQGPIAEEHADESLWLSSCGRPFYKEAKAPTMSRAQAALPHAMVPLSETFTLNSQPGASKTIYLDFDGDAISGKAWNSAQGFNQPFIASPAYSRDGNVAFSDTELKEIQHIWAIVAEDYSLYDVNVTTQLPAAEKLSRTTQSDNEFGFRAVMTTNNVIGEACDCGGIAWLNTGILYGPEFDYYSHAFIFIAGTGNYYNVAQAASHEIGHNLGLEHDGTLDSEYYPGHELWGTIMGSPYNRPLSQWDQGEFNGAVNNVDDIGTISDTFDFRNDDHSGTRTSASTLNVGSERSGVIGPWNDVDMWRFNASGATEIKVTVPRYANLDPKMTLMNATGNVIKTYDPALTNNTSDLFAPHGLSIVANPNLAAGTYYLKIEGAGLDRAPGPYTSYGSVGAYKLSLATSTNPVDEVPDLLVVEPVLPNATVNQNYNSPKLNITGGMGPYTVTVNKLPAGLGLDPTTGAIRGTPQVAGSYSFIFTVTSADEQRVQVKGNLVVGNEVVYNVSNDTPASKTIYNDESFEWELRASGGSGNYYWQASGMPAGVKFENDRLRGKVTTPGTYRIQTTVSEFNRGSSSKTLTLTVKKRILNPKFTTKATLKTGKVKKNYSVIITVKSDAKVTWSRSGALPKGLKWKVVSGSGGKKIKIYGKPSKVKTYKFTAKAQNAAGTTSKKFTLRIKR